MLSMHTGLCLGFKQHFITKRQSPWTYEEHAKRFWKHLLSVPSDQSPMKDKTGEKCAVGQETSKNIVEHDLKHVGMADVLVVIAHSPSYGTGMEMVIAKNSFKQIILLASYPLPTPWPVTIQISS